MKEEYKRKAETHMDSMELRMKPLTEMLNGQRQANPDDARRFAKEISYSLEKLREIISIS